MGENLIPLFIHDKYSKNRFKGKFKAITMFVDIVGFTDMTEKLIHHGKEGAEILSEVIYQVFEPAIDSIYLHQGWVSTFAGDAFIAVFEGNDMINPIFAAKDIQSFFDLLKVETKYGDFDLKVRVGLSYGKVSWGIVETDKQSAYYFKGEAIRGCSWAEKICSPGEIIIDMKVKKLIPENAVLNRRNEGYFQLGKVKSPGPEITTLHSHVLKDSILSKFVPDEVLKMKELGEFRNVVSLFISFSTTDEPDELIKEVIKEIHQYGGYLNKVNFGDKGGVILILFGAPTGIEKPALRAVEFALSLIKAIDERTKVRIGITQGMVYAGMIGSGNRMEYTSIGEIVNLSARFMMEAEWGDIFVDEKIKRELGERFVSKYMGKLQLKGFAEKIPVHKIISEENIRERVFAGSMVGREKEIKELTQYIKPIKKGKFGGIIYVDGSPGIGKSRLVNGFKEKLKKENYTWFYLPCDNILRESFNPLVSFSKAYFNQDKKNSPEKNRRNFERKLMTLINETGDDEIKKELKRTESILGAMINLYEEDSLYQKLDAKGRYKNTLFAFKNLIKAESLLNPTIIELEDGQWIDADTLEFLSILTRNVEDFPFVIISTCRLKDDGSFFRFDLPEIPAHNIHLKKIDREMSNVLIEDRLGGKASVDLQKLICNKSEGNPFYIEQIVLYLLNSKAICKKEGIYELIEEKFRIPGKISSIVMARIDRLEAKLKELIKTASVLGREFSVRILSSMLRGEEIEDNLKKGEEEAIWRAVSEIIYIFTHTILRDTVYGVQLQKTLHSLHKLAAETMEKSYKEELNIHFGELAYHYEKAEVKNKAEEYLRKAGDYARNNYKNEDALNFYQRLLKYISSPEERIKVLEKKGEILELIGKWDKVEDIYRKNLENAKKINNRKAISDNQVNLGTILWRKGDNETAYKLLNLAKKTFEEMDDKKGLCRATGTLGNIYYREGDYQKAMEFYLKQSSISEELGIKKEKCVALKNMGNVHNSQSDYEKATEWYNKALIIAEDSELRQEISIILGNMAVMFKNQGNYQKAMEYCQKSLSIAEELGDILGVSYCSTTAGSISLERRKYSRALEYYRKQMDIDKELGNKQGITAALINMGEVYLYQDEYKKALNHNKRALKLAEELNDKHYILCATGNMGDAFKILGEYEKARKYYERCLSLCQELDSKQNISIAYGNIAELFRKTGNFDRAIDYLDKAIKISRELQLKPVLCSYLSRKADLFFSMNSPVEAKNLNDEAMQMAEEMQLNDILFQCEVLKSRILFEEDRNSAIEKLKNLLNDNSDEVKRATLHYELFQMTGDDFHKNKALNIYQKLYEKSPNIDYRDMVEELQEE